MKRKTLHDHTVQTRVPAEVLERMRAALPAGIGIASAFCIFDISYAFRLTTVNRANWQYVMVLSKKEMESADFLEEMLPVKLKLAGLLDV